MREIGRGGKVNVINPLAFLQLVLDVNILSFLKMVFLSQKETQLYTRQDESAQKGVDTSKSRAWTNRPKPKNKWFGPIVWSGKTNGLDQSAETEKKQMVWNGKIPLLMIADSRGQPACNLKTRLLGAVHILLISKLAVFFGWKTVLFLFFFSTKRSRKPVLLFSNAFLMEDRKINVLKKTKTKTREKS